MGDRIPLACLQNSPVCLSVITGWKPDFHMNFFTYEDGPNRQEAYSVADLMEGEYCRRSCVWAAYDFFFTVIGTLNSYRVPSIKSTCKWNCALQIECSTANWFSGEAECSIVSNFREIVTLTASLPEIYHSFLLPYLSQPNKWLFCECISFLRRPSYMFSPS